ncbi:MAG: hypothetical protein WKG01_24555 [Kofleriaceae bacterium]
MTREPVKVDPAVPWPIREPGHSGLLGIEIERKGNVYIEARIRRQRARTVEGS